MKIALYLVVLVAVVVAIGACGGGGSSARDTYQLEKLRSEALKAQERLGIKPELATEDDLRAVIAEHLDVVEYFKNNFSYLENVESPSNEEIYSSNLAGESLLSAGRLYLNVGDSTAAKEAFADFETIFHHNPGQQKYAWISLAMLFDSEQQEEKVEELYNKLVKTYYPPVDSAQNPDLEIIGLPYSTAAFFHAVGNKEKAERYSREAIDYYNTLRDSFPESGTWMLATRYLAETYRSIDQPRTAIELLHTVVDTTGGISRGAMMLTARTYFENLNQPDSAIKYYRKVLEQGIDSLYGPPALMQLANVLVLERRFEQGEQVLNQILDLNVAADQRPMAYRMLAICHEERKQYDQARDAYLAIIEKYPTHSLSYETYLYLPEFFEKQGQKQLRDQWYNRAEVFFRDMQTTYPERAAGAAAQEYLARLYIKYENWNDAVRELSKLPEQYENYRYATDAYFRIGSIYQTKLNKPDSARAYYQRQIDSYPDTRPSDLAQQSIETL